jgi:imidazolonepropionase-like amidohydrolase
MKQTALAVRFGTLHHNTGDPMHNGVLIVKGDRIATIGGPDTKIPDGTRTIEAPCVVPGLINCHAHLEMSGEAQTTSVFVLTTPVQRALVAAKNAREALECGVTTMRDLGSSENIAIDARDAIEAGKILGPTILAVGRPICMTGGHGWWIGREADGEWDVRKAVREQRRAGADCIKFIATGGVLTKGAVPGIDQLHEEELRAGIDEAHKHGLHCAAHAIGASGIKNAIRAGVDSIEHGHLIDEEGVRLALERGTFIVPTLAAVTSILDGGPDAGMPDFVLRKARELGQHLADNLRRARAAGVKFAGGSDAGTPFNLHGGYAYELELMQTVLGMSAREALAASTVGSAELLGIRRGKLVPGEVADFVLLAKDPDAELRAFRSTRAVVRGGVVAYERAA